MTLRKSWLALVLGCLLLPALPSAQETTVGNNLSYPAAFTGASTLGPSFFDLTATAANLTTGGFSYGCVIPTTEGTTTYPNLSCVDASTGAALTLEQCTLLCGAVPVEEIYWQQSPLNTWQADVLAGQTMPLADYLDWGDNLETVTWSERSIIRVEAQPFTATPVAPAPAVRGFQMWHVANQGPDEMWGVRAKSAANPYVYDAQYAIVNTPSFLNLTKLGGAATCPSTTAIADRSPYQPLTDGTKLLTWSYGPEETTGAGFGKWTPTSATVKAYEVLDIPYTAELNIGGKYVYGYNWNLKNQVMPAGAVKTGWWRLTYYTGSTTARTVAFAASTILTAPPAPSAAPLDGSPPVLPPPVDPPSETTSGTFYVPAVDLDAQVTYIDICIGSNRGGGGRGGSSRGGE